MIRIYKQPYHVILKFINVFPIAITNTLEINENVKSLIKEKI